jgi:YjbE family integral membrane protein
MDLSDGTNWIFVPIQIFLLDLLLCADNAVIIALASRSLRHDDRRKVVLAGAVGAAAFRLIMTIVASFLLATPYLKLASGLILLVIAVDVIDQQQNDDRDHCAKSAGVSLTRRGSLWLAVSSILLLDATMGLDNVVALAALAQGNAWLLLAGVLFSIPLVVLGSVILVETLRYLQRHQALINAGCAMLGWVAGDMAVSDSAVANWANAHVPILVLISPLLGAAFVLGEPEFITRRWRVWFARKDAAKESRAVQLGLISIAAITVGMSGYVLYLNSLLSQ